MLSDIVVFLFRKTIISKEYVVYSERSLESTNAITIVWVPISFADGLITTSISSYDCRNNETKDLAL